MSGHAVLRRAGWEIVALWSEQARIEILPGKGGDILSLRRAADGLSFLWSSPWGLRPRAALSAASSSEGRLMEAYPGGWQTVFPNGGDESAAQHSTWGMHGEAWLASYDWQIDGRSSTLEMRAELVQSPFSIRKRVRLDGARVVVTETITNRGGHAVDAMWSHHPAFGAPFLSADCVLQTAASRITVDAQVPNGRTDLQPGGTGRWPDAPGLDRPLDLREIPGRDAKLSRMAYLSDFDTGLISLRNQRLDAGIRLEWNADLMPYAWYWLEADGSPGFPWYQSAYVLGLEPATSIPGHGISAAGNTVLNFAPGAEKTAELVLTITDGSGTETGRITTG
jgi:hypothetical protein